MKLDIRKRLFTQTVAESLTELKAVLYCSTAEPLGSGHSMKPDRI